jgi:glycosyltransferase involved in cell wall biosynthesis
VLEDAAIEARAGDVFLGLDLQPHVVAARRDDYRTLRAHGVAVHFVVYDLLPIVLPSAFPHGAAEHHSEWLDVVAASDGALCISQAVATELQHWLVQRKVERARPLQVETFKLGADIAASVPTTGMPDDASAVIQQLRAAPSFLMVGTLEPRKAHGQVLAAFELLWEAGCKAQLVIVGKQGWLVDTLAKRLRGHPELGQQLFWLESISDQYLHEVFGACAALVAASHGEGFGLPLIEAAQQGLPIIARNIPVFVEVAGEHAFYFDGSEPGDLAQALQQWLRLHGEGKAPGSQALPWSTWSQSTASLVSKLHLLP